VDFNDLMGNLEEEVNTDNDGEEIVNGVKKMKQTKPSWSTLAKFFVGATLMTILKTFIATTQYARSGIRGINMQHNLKAPNPALNVRRRHEPVSTDTIYSNVAAVDDGSVAAHFFVG
jgi:hypothetical protein